MPTQREMDIKRTDMLRNERSSWVEHWRDIGYFISPRRFRYLYTDRNKGHKQNQFIINNTGTRALRTQSAGMMSGITSPSSEWFELTLPDADLARYGRVRQWLDAVRKVLLDTFAKSNIYNCLHSTYEYLGAFGTACVLVEEDFKDGLRGYPFPIGQYMLGNSFRLQVDTVHREFSMSVIQMVDKFGLKNCSVRVQREYEAGNYDSWVEVVHCIGPAQTYAPGKAKFKWRSDWIEKVAAGETQEGGYLRQSGFQEFPCMAPRWAVTGEDVYGSSPGMDALGDIRALQTLERRKAQAMDKIVNPPMTAPMALMNQRVSTMPGDTIYVDANVSGQVVRPAVEIQSSAVEVAEASIREHEQRIEATFFTNLWLSLTQSDDTQKTAREVVERHEEKMLQLGPVMERIENELLDPLIERSLAILVRAGKLPPAPPELRGQEMRVEYMSIVAQARKLMKTAGIERLMGMVGNLAGVKPEVLDKIDMDAVVEVYAEALDVDAEVIVDADAVAKIRAHRAQDQKQQMDIAKLQAIAQGAANLSKADMTGDNALTRVASALPAAAVPSAQVGGVH